jgi:hypothetical protein
MEGAGDPPAETVGIITAGVPWRQRHDGWHAVLPDGQAATVARVEGAVHWAWDQTWGRAPHDYGIVATCAWLTAAAKRRRDEAKREARHAN